ncbi:MAG: class I SAM-dependent methyltransferase [Planctomycetes bacterium]|nr:class I SAM-dependent methyltransferase [Planctomycetota bacterium]
MPSIRENLSNWDDQGKWTQDGDEWSESWGSSATMWAGTIMPRIGACLPVRELVEIACGHGRVTQFLLPHCDRYRGFDLAPTCVAVCTERFADRRHATFAGTDGSSLPGIDAASVDFVVSWDSLVHAERDAMVGYVREIGRVLLPGGTAFLHHSTMADHVDPSGKLTVANPHWRGTTVSAGSVRADAEAAGLRVVVQELVAWGSPTLSDCFTLLHKPSGDSGPAREPVLLRNTAFNSELAYLSELDRSYRRALRG